MSWNLEEAVSYYQSMGAPQDQNALVNLLKEIQKEQGGTVPAHIPAVLAETLGTKEGLILALIRRMPSLRLGDTHILELCAGPNCGKHRELADYAETLSKKKGFILKFIPCQRMCGKGPNVKWDGTIWHQATKELLDEICR